MNTNEAFAVLAPREGQDKKGCILTKSGHLFNPLDPDPALIEIVDIANGLACETRYAGHLPDQDNWLAGFYSVAQHSVLVSNRLTTRELKLAALLHDAEEAYIKDLPSPLKSHPGMLFYVERGDRLRKAIFERFDVDYDLYLEVVKPVDDLIYFEERAHFHGRVINYEFRPVSPAHARTQFLRAWRVLEP